MFRILVLCKTNAILGPMAEGYLRKFAGDDIDVYSAGIVLEKVDPVVIGLMKEDDIDLSVMIQHKLDDFKHIDFDFVLTCDEESEAISHHLPSKLVKYHFDFHKLIPDNLKKSDREDVLRKVRNKIKKAMLSFIRNHFSDSK